jgi:hypothetical protein
MGELFGAVADAVAAVIDPREYARIAPIGNPLKRKLRESYWSGMDPQAS